MVQLSVCKLCKALSEKSIFTKSRFLDSLSLYVKGGSGGNGQPKYGGLGGRGGNVVCKVKAGASLESVKKQFKGVRITAASGDNSLVHRLAGRNGEDKILELPVGITAYADGGTKLGELNTEEDSIIIAHGGAGGNAQNGWLGRKGEELAVRLELKLIADIGLVGFPNAGKSTFLKAISRARPKIASYPFTTIKPNVGVITFDDFRKMSVADLPGLIEGAHRNLGMGHQFLRHVERTKLIAMIVDVNGFQLGLKHPKRSCVETVLLLNKELELYKMNLLEKPIILLVNKMDVEGAQEIYDGIRDTLHNLKDHIHKYPEEFQPEKVIKFQSILPISAKTNSTDVNDAKLKIRSILDLLAEEEQEMVDRELELVKKLKSSLREHQGEMII
ncbi:GTP-binding protein 10 homolog isoform X2 [Diaphorina citri]|uniref:GTP-binding protein 10 homolog isoform X2 n=1 Tax=Diaphorina citri TaxID=121845 RepID=A0A1S3D8B6_DIACI|nr:GTP-binding protein 10 homolog isoform X2 [Diaphorina citri]